MGSCTGGRGSSYRSAMELEGKVALVTGASRGIGRATAVALAARGMRVAVCSRNGEVLRELADEIGGLAVVGDVREEAGVERVLGEVIEAMGGLDVLVNSAGIGRIAAVSDGDPVDWRAMWEVNVMGTALCSRAALAVFPQGGGHIVNLGSLSGHRVPSVGGFYSATKHAVRAMTEAMRVELRKAGSRTRVTMLSPGFVDTPLVDEYLGAAGKTREDLGLEMIPVGEVARAVVHVLEAPDAVEYHDILLRPREQIS